MDERQDFRNASLDAEPSVKREPEEITILDIPRTPKRRRYIMDGVFLPTTESLGIKRRRVDDECSTQPQPKKIKKGDRSVGLAAGTLRKRLISAGINTDPFTITLPADLKDVSARRDFMSIFFGGNRQSTCPTITKKSYRTTGYRYFMYPSLVQNPDAPMIPGAPGLFLDAAGWPASECDKDWASEAYNMKVLTRLGAHDFLYMGEYAIRPSDSLTRAEWLSQPPAMRIRWCTKLAKKDWGMMTRTRIALRRQLGRDATFKEVTTSLKAKQKFPSITAVDIAKAFNNGEERLAVWTMKCVGYDEKFQRDIVRKITGWVPPPPKTKPKSKKATTVKRVSSGKKGVRRPRR
ncbi:hypothetical protein B0H16DRAFT_730995 [Mycena metata]|uniref:DUF6697 domain-containing protein n=1 Tax=Mycena metata TaxID=1033252 RepID=A0AAD7NBS4_9AGAR|nr:hypothetical protein B0H16DRAFT_730995 [Mycena metata]